MADRVFVYYSHLINDVILREIDRICEELPETYDVWIIGCVEDTSIYDRISNLRVKRKAYNRRDLNLLPYKEKLRDLKPGSTRGSNDLAILNFYRTNRDYTTYWFIEYDVRYTGSWQKLLSELDQSSADLICTHLNRFIYDDGWVHWSTLRSPTGEITSEQKIRGFLPFCRISARLLEKIDDYCTLGWSGHYEALWPTIANLEKFAIEEVGGVNEFTPLSRRGKFYHSSFINKELFMSTFAAWPVFDESSNFDQHIKDTLWHPVKMTVDVSLSKPKDHKAHHRDLTSSPKIAVVTMVYNEPDFLPLWNKYYSSQVGHEHCYVIDHGSDDGSISENNIENRIYVPRTSTFEEQRLKFVSSFCEGLLSYYETVIYTDVDEFLVCDPTRFSSLSEFCASNSEPVITALGLNVLHRFKYDTPILTDRPILEQRAWAFASAAMSKPLVIKRPTKWTKGFHTYDGPPVFNGLINFHLPLYDYHTALRRQAKRRYAASTMTDVGSHHQMTDDELTNLFVAYSSMSVDETISLTDSCTEANRFINSILKSSAERQSQYYKIDLGLKSNQLWRIPEIFRTKF